MPELPLVLPKPPLKEPTPASFTSVPEQKKEFKLPKIEHPAIQPIPQPQPRIIKAHDDDLRKFEEAIQNIDINMIHNESPEEAASTEAGDEQGYYKPHSMGEGYFSEIEHYIRNKDVNEILDDVLKKDFLTGMKDYHDTKAQGKPFYIHTEDLKTKLKAQMDELRGLEEEWHGLRARIEAEEKKKKQVEQRIDAESQELKDLFKQIKVNQLLEKEAFKEHYFKLRNGQELKSLNDLRKALSYMADEEFSHHANPERNDFATWTREALQMPELAEKIKNAKSKEELQEALKNPL